MSIPEIVTNIDARIAQLESEIQPLLDAKLALLNSSEAPKPAKHGQISARKTAASPPEPALPAETGRPAPKRRPRRAARRLNDTVPSGKLISLLGASDGLTASALAEA